MKKTKSKAGVSLVANTAYGITGFAPATPEPTKKKRKKAR